ncbi:MAG TPA: hypothetical protein VMQ62_13170, partial [Dongiaceae bacterium]|nr:hypothetical protein [Dongiaceae bacterium]
MAILAAFLLAIGSAHLAGQRPGDLGMTLSPCRTGTCVDWVMPAGFGWHRGARPGMRVLSSLPDPGRPTEARLETATGELLPVSVGAGAGISPEAEIGLGIVGLAFALLAAAVLVRRPHDLTARLFALFGGLAAVALGVAPAAGGPHPAWALIVQFVSILAFGATVPAFAGAFVGNRNGPGAAMRLFWLFGGGILATYLFALVFKPAVYEVVRVLFGLYLTVSIFAALGLLARRASGPSLRPAVHEARLALAGIACGALPFVILTLIPVTTGYRDVVPWYITASLTGFIPAAFAYAILRHQLLGIRRLIHRGMVYGITAVALLIVLSLLVNASRHVAGGRASSAVTVGLAVIGALLFDLLRRGARRVVDRVFYRDEVDSQALLADM